MPAGRPRRPNDPSVLSSLEAAVRQPHRSGPIEFCWHWRWELGMLGATAGTAGLVAASLGVIWLAVAAAAGLAVLGAMVRCPPARSRIVARAWCIVTPHRIRTGCASAWAQSRSGRLPFVLGTVPAWYGQRVQLWCPAGITAADLFAARHVLAAACWAAEVRVIPSARYAHIVTLEVIRTHHPERGGPALPGWPYSGLMDADARDDLEERSITGA